MLMLFFDFFHMKDYQRSGYLGAIYSCISLILSFLLFFGINKLLLFNLISNLVFFILAYFFLNDLKNYSSKPVDKEQYNEKSIFLLFLKYFVFIIVLTNLALITTLSLHEFSHVLVSRIYGCEARSIFYEVGSYPYSEIVCDNLAQKMPIALAGIIAPLIIGLFAFIIGGWFVRPISFLIIGFNFSQDGFLKIFKSIFQS